MTMECLPNNETNPSLTKEVFTMLYFTMALSQTKFRMVKSYWRKRWVLAFVEFTPHFFVENLLIHRDISDVLNLSASSCIHPDTNINLYS